MRHTEYRRQLFAVAVALGLFAALSPVALSAHHGWGGYEDNTSDLTGTVTSPVSLAGPHATMKVKVADQVWDVVLAPPARTERAGLKEGMIAIGDTVSIHGNRHRDPKKFEIKTSRLTWNGRVFSVYPERN